ncbi:uncharacterized protein [Leptinotarsa decemlineata]|uniref:uncharacterized protein n=1 Tax=Leptinotarsa decemlineata TaxID=7539 RepID=UPI003D30D5B8
MKTRNTLLKSFKVLTVNNSVLCKADSLVSAKHFWDSNMNFLMLFSIAVLTVQVSSFGGGDDKFLKKYAMMKIYESCFGDEVVKQIRKEMKQACAKCANMDSPTYTAPTYAPPTPPTEEKPQQGEEINPDPNSVYQPSIDSHKLHQAIIAFRPNSPSQSSFRPFQGPASFYNLPFGNPGYPYPGMYYPGVQQMPFPQYNFPIVGQQYYGNRMSRDMDVKSQLEILTSKMSGRVRNVTCVMQELGYLDNNLEPNYVKISERITNLPVSEELRKDMQDGVAFCQQFSQCVPEVNKEKSPLSRELIRPMFFFKCYKHKKLEACIMKDVRDKFSGVADDELESDMDLSRTGKAMDFPKADKEREIDDLASSMYEFLYTSDSNLDVDELF